MEAPILANPDYYTGVSEQLKGVGKITLTPPFFLNRPQFVELKPRFSNELFEPADLLGYLAG